MSENNCHTANDNNYGLCQDQYDTADMINKNYEERITAKSMKTTVKINQENSINSKNHNIKKRLAS